MKTIYHILLFLFISSALSAQPQITSNTLVANNELQLNGKSYTSIPSSGGQVFLEDYTGADFGVSLQAAIDDLPAEGGIVNCRGVVGAQEMSDSISIDKPVRILLGQMTLTMNNPVNSNKNMFNIRSSGVDIIGLGRSPKGNKMDGNTIVTYNRTGKTKLVMANGAGDVLQGYHIYNRGNSSITIKDLDMDGVQTDLGRQYGSSTYPLNGAGGIYMERDNPDTRLNDNDGSGNVSQIIIENVYIENTKAHAIYMDTPVVSLINNVRISGAGGHGVFIWGGTTCNLNSVYVSSANQAGVVLWSHSYASVLNSVTEYCGIGWWFRSVQNISVFVPGVEQTYNLNKPWKNTQPSTGFFGLGLETTKGDGTLFRISDVGDSQNEFRGYGYFITGGKGLQIFSPYCTDPGNEKTYSVYPAGSGLSEKTRYIKVASTNKNSVISCPRFNYTKETIPEYQYDVEIGDDVECLKLEWNPEDGVVTPTNSSVPIIENDTSTDKANILLLSGSTIVVSGRKLFTPFQAQ